MAYLAAAFIVLWLAVGLYVAFMLVRQRRLEQDLAMLEEQLAERREREQRQR